MSSFCLHQYSLKGVSLVWYAWSCQDLTGLLQGRISNNADPKLQYWSSDQIRSKKAPDCTSTGFWLESGYFLDVMKFVQLSQHRALTTLQHQPPQSMALLDLHALALVALDMCKPGNISPKWPPFVLISNYPSMPSVFTSPRTCQMFSMKSIYDWMCQMFSEGTPLLIAQSESWCFERSLGHSLHILHHWYYNMDSASEIDTMPWCFLHIAPEEIWPCVI